MKTEDFAKLLERAARSIPNSGSVGDLRRIAEHALNRPEDYRKALARVETEPNIPMEEIRDALVTIKLFLVQPTLTDRLVDVQLQRRARIAMTKVWNALLPDYEEKEKKPFKQHALTCPAYGNYQPPYEECDCGVGP